MTGLIRSSRKRKANLRGGSFEERFRRYEENHKSDLIEIELWKKIALELSELNKNNNKGD